MTYEDAQRKVHDAIGAMLDDDEFAMGWTLTIDDRRYLAHRAGGGADGTDGVMQWTALGMLRAGAAVAEQQLLEGTVDHEDDDE